MKRDATAVAHPNIALIKYWGKRDTRLNLPATGSLSITLDTLKTTTQVRFDPTLAADRLVLDDAPAASASRVSDCLDLLRSRAGTTDRAEIRTSNNFPTGAGLASSASGFAALVVAADAALNLSLSRDELSVLARRGSGSAARSIYGGYVEMTHGAAADGNDSKAHLLHEAGHWPLSVTVAVVSREQKQVGSTEGMERTRHSAPYYQNWIDGAESDLAEARAAIAARDFQKLADVSEFSCLKMHALAMAARPGLVYFRGPTIEAMHAVRTLRGTGHPVFFTIDAGPQLKAVSLPSAAPAVADALGAIPGVQDIISAGLGEGARLVD